MEGKRREMAMLACHVDSCAMSREIEWHTKFKDPDLYFILLLGTSVTHWEKLMDCQHNLLEKV